MAIGARRTSNLEKLQDEIEKSGGQAFAQKLDVSDRQNCNSFVNEVLKKWNTIDVLVNNAVFLRIIIEEKNVNMQCSLYLAL